jgi:hypothetical protein
LARSLGGISAGVVVENNFEVPEEGEKVGTGWIVVNVLALAASLALCAILWNEFFVLDGRPFF